MKEQSALVSGHLASIRKDTRTEASHPTWFLETIVVRLASAVHLKLLPSYFHSILPYSIISLDYLRVSAKSTKFCIIPFSELCPEPIHLRRHEPLWDEGICNKRNELRYRCLLRYHSCTCIQRSVKIKKVYKYFFASYFCKNAFMLLPPAFSPPSAKRIKARPPELSHAFISENSTSEN